MEKDWKKYGNKMSLSLKEILWSIASCGIFALLVLLLEITI